MTANEVIELAFTRNISTDHVLQSDIDTAKLRYVDAYIEDYDSESAFYADYCKPVIAYGVATDIINRIDMELTDRGVQRFDAQGATTPDNEAKFKLKREYARKRDKAIETMVMEAKQQAGVGILFDFEKNAVYTAGIVRDTGL